MILITIHSTFSPLLDPLLEKVEQKQTYKNKFASFLHFKR
jgi:hypothetical protein